MRGAPVFSVIIPTHNRCSSVRRALTSLTLQNYPASQFEVIVVADGCSDNTVEMVQQFKTGFLLKVFPVNAGNAAGARNFGAARARGRMLLFLDDDIEAVPALIESHGLVHQRKPQQVVIGYLPPRFEGALDFFRIGLRCWWEEQFFQMARPEHRFTYRDLLSGNFSLETELFRRLGGFNPGFGCREDYELGYRLIKSNAHFAFSPAASGWHYDASTLSRACQRVFDEGRADVGIGRRHPELRAPLLFFKMERFTSVPQKLLFRLAFERSRLGDFLAGILYRRLGLLEKIRYRGRWRELFYLLRHYWYWRGVATETGTRSALAGFLQSSPFHPVGSEIEIDLRQGLKRAECDLDAIRPDAALLYYGETFIGSIQREIGAEPLRSNHLRPVLAKKFSKRLLAAVALERATALEPMEVLESIPEYADQGF
ncbi:MAG: glycosyl transferase family 2 [Verrucomicrobiales bacterium]|nr:glycosyl transferase family 2 [Verrucomicrobiales bacterium]